MVTGCTDGIGKAFCEELAKKKINLVLIRWNSAISIQHQSDQMRSFSSR